MGLDITHDAFHGSYSSFDRFRQAVAKSCGGSYPTHDDASLDPSSWYLDTNDDGSRLALFLSHSDYDGELTPEECTSIANEMEVLLQRIDACGYGDVARQFIAGCRAAAAANEPLVFH